MPETPKCPVCGSTLNTESEINEDPFLKDVTASWVCPAGCTFDQEQIEYFPYKICDRYVSKKELQEKQDNCSCQELRKEMNKLAREKAERSSPYIVALEHKDFSCENMIINAESPDEIFDILIVDSPGVVNDCRRIMIGPVGKMWGNESSRTMSENDKLHIISLEEEISKKMPMVAQKIIKYAEAAVKSWEKTVDSEEKGK